jgi:hypothetical protein
MQAGEIAGGWSRHPVGDRSSEIAEVATVLDSVLVPLEFAPAQLGASGTRGQVIFCRGAWDVNDEACVDLVIDLMANSDWQIVEVRYWGFTADRWHLDFDREAPLSIQLAGLALSLPNQLE